MNAFWSFFWPLLGFGLLAGVVAGLIGYRRRPGMLLVDYLRRRARVPIAGGVVCVVAALLWMGPLGAADRFVTAVDREVRASLVYNEMTMMQAHLHRHPLTRDVALSGPADDFQRGALAEALENLPGVHDASWGMRAGACRWCWRQRLRRCWVTQSVWSLPTSSNCGDDTARNGVGN